MTARWAQGSPQCTFPPGDEHVVWCIGGLEVGGGRGIWMANPEAGVDKAEGKVIRFRVISGPANGS